MDCQDKCANGMQGTKVAGTLMFVMAEEIRGDGIGMTNGRKIRLILLDNKLGFPYT